MTIVEDLSVEVLSRIFEEMDLEDAWNARAVCRFWRSVFGFVAYGVAGSVYLKDSRIGLDVICKKTSAKGDGLDQHVIHGDLIFDPDKQSPSSAIARWTAKTKFFEFWPGGSWRKCSVGDLLTDIRMSFTKMPSTPDFILQPGTDITINYSVRGPQSNVQSPQTVASVFKDFIISVDVHGRKLPNGKSEEKHCISSFIAPKWQIYALLARHSKVRREWIERVDHHYLRTTCYLHKTIPAQSTNEERTSDYV
jgi:F-box domain